MQFRKGTLGLFEEEEAEEGHNQTSHAEHLEESAVGRSNDLRCGLSATTHPHGQQAEDGEVGHRANVAVGAHQTSHLASHAALHQRHQGKGGAFTGLDKEGGQHRDQHSHSNAGGTGEGAGLDHAHDQVTNSQAKGEEAHGVFARAQTVGDQSATGASHQIHKGKAGSQDSSGGLGQVEGGFKEGGQHRDHRQLRTKVDDVGELKDGHLLELVAVFLGIDLRAHDQLTVGANDPPGLEDKPHQNGQQSQRIGGSIEESNLLQAPAKDAKNGRERHIHAKQSPEITHGGDFKTSCFFRALIHLSRRSITDVAVINDAVNSRDDAGEGNGTTPVQDRTGGQLKTTREGQPTGHTHQGQGGERGAKVAPAAVDALSQADFLGREPFGHHADADHKAGANDGKQQTGHHQLVEVLRSSEHQAGNDRKHQQGGVGQAWTEFVEKHADQHASRDGERNVADRHGADLANGQTQVSLHRGGEGSQVEPNNKREKEGEPGEMQRAISPLERPKVAKHESQGVVTDPELKMECSGSGFRALPKQVAHRAIGSAWGAS